MPDWRVQIRTRLAPLHLAPLREAEIVEEVAQHLEDRYRDMRARGADEVSAVAAAWRELEHQDVLPRELAREERPGPHENLPPGAPAPGRWVAALWWDLRSAVRSLRQQPVFAATVLTALALSIGPTTAVVSLGNWLFWRPLPGLADPGRLGSVEFGTSPRQDYVIVDSLSATQLADVGRGLTSATGLAGVQEEDASLVIGDEVPRVVGLAEVTADFFGVLGVHPVAGRTFLPDEDRGPLGTPVVVVSERLARRSFGSPEAALDRRLEVNLQPFRVIGVTPAGFFGVSSTSNVDIWITGATQTYLDNAGPPTPGSEPYQMEYAKVIARLAPHAGVPQVEAELGARVRALTDVDPAYRSLFASASAHLFPGLALDPRLEPQMRTMFGVLLAIAGVLLVLGCANASNVLIARAIRREREITVRRALGAAGWRLVQLQIVESCVLGVGGASLGLVLAYVLKQVMQTLLFPAYGFDALRPLPIDFRVLSFTVMTALLVGTLAGLAPAWLSARGRLIGLPGSSALRTTTRAPRLRSALAAVQLALSLTLLIGALLLVSTLRNLHAVDLGFDPANLSTFQLDLRKQKYDQTRALAFDQDLLHALAALPSLTGATIASQAPFFGRMGMRLVPPGASEAETLQVLSNSVVPSYFDVLGTPVIHGRTFTAAEAFVSTPMDNTMPVIVNEALAHRLFGDADPLGRTVHLPARANTPAIELPIVGVVGDAHFTSFSGNPDLVVYQPLGRSSAGSSRVVLMVRSSRSSVEVVSEVRAPAARLDRYLPLTGGEPLSVYIDGHIRQQRLLATMLTWVSALAFVLAAVGLHGLVAQATTERAREFGIRMAIGASRRAIARLVGRYVFVVAASGVVVGLALAAVAARLLSAMLFGVGALDPLTYAVAVGVMGLIVVFAAAWPALRATRVPVVDVLRAE
jgi:predicted permease